MWWLTWKSENFKSQGLKFILIEPTRSKAWSGEGTGQVNNWGRTFSAEETGSTKSWKSWDWRVTCWGQTAARKPVCPWKEQASDRVLGDVVHRWGDMTEVLVGHLAMLALSLSEMWRDWRVLSRVKICVLCYETGSTKISSMLLN